MCDTKKMLKKFHAKMCNMKKNFTKMHKTCMNHMTNKKK